ncbi:MAG: hypothetical protein JW888_16815 [Pirellulales bacterium]|nr:hypothetical protein [Pirellulales bacterium]
MFEASYSFDLEGLRKKNLGPATDALKKINGTTDFAVSCVVQFALGGHSIPLDAGSLEVMRILGLATEEEVEKHSISGLERAVPKSKGIEFGSLLHQLGADFTANPFSSEVRSKLLEIEPEAKNRWPKRRSTKSAAKTLAAKGESRKKQTTKKTSEGRAKEEPKSGVKKRKKPAGTSKKATAKKKTTKKSTTSIKRKATSSGKKSSNRSVNKKKASDGLSKRKPR